MGTPGLGLKRFMIEGLHRHRNLSIPIEDDKLILVGQNGAGKTTVITTLYLALSRQWRRLLDGPRFSSLKFEFTDGVFQIQRRDLVHFCRSGRESRVGSSAVRRLSPGIRERLMASGQLEAFIEGPHAVRMHIARLNAIPFHALREFEATLDHPDEPEAAHPDAVPNPAVVQAFDDYVAARVEARVLYLPTYRRIEKDLGSIFPDLEEHVNEFRGRHRRRWDSSSSQADRKFLELVEFGMEDVKADVDRILISLKDLARTLVIQLAGSYLRDVIRGEAHDFNLTSVTSMENQELERILNRVEERTLDDQDKSRLREMVARLKGGADPTHADRSTARVLTKLIDVDRELAQKEQPLKAFASAATSYLYGKAIGYNERTYEVSVVLLDTRQEIPWSALSSGEKQIVSLWARLLLDDGGVVA